MAFWASHTINLRQLDLKELYSMNEFSAQKNVAALYSFVMRFAKRLLN